jgi:hypothetical protein
MGDFNATTVREWEVSKGILGKMKEYLSNNLLHS